MAQTKLTIDQREELLGLGATNADLKEYREEGYTFEEMKRLCLAAQGARDVELQGAADRNAKATKHAMRPENETAPGFSVFHPKGTEFASQLKCNMFWIGNPVMADVYSDSEIDLMNQVQPGVYTCHKADGSIFQFIAEASFASGGRITQMTFSFPCSGMNRHNHRSCEDILKEVLAQTPLPLDKPVRLLAMGAS